MRRAVLATLLVLACVPASAHAAQVTVDFDSSPPGPALGTVVTDEYAASAFVRFLLNDPGFRPYRTSAPGLARSGTVVADVGPDVCAQEGGTGSDCEIVTGGTTGRLTRAATAVTLYAGLFDAPSGAVSAHLVAYRNGGIVLTGPSVAIGTGGFTTAVTVSLPSGTMDQFQLVVDGPGAPGASIGFDDLTLTFPASSLPDVSLSVPPNPVAVLKGESVDVPFDITRLDSSNGDLHFSVSGLPTGVTATVLPNPLTGTGQTATLRLTADAAAPDVVDPATITLTADPQGNGAVAQGARSAPLLVRVASPYELRAGPAGTTAPLPDCVPADLPVVVARDNTFNGTVTLHVDNLPSGVSAQILPSATIAPGGSFFATATIRLSRSPGVVLPKDIVVRATSTGLADRTLGVHLVRAPDVAELSSGLGFAPRHLTPGTALTITGNGFCPGTTLQVGNGLAIATPDVAADGKSLSFTVPRLATSGPVFVIPPDHGLPYPTTFPLTVGSFRMTDGFAFKNPTFGSLSISELTDAFGANDLFIQVNPCWPEADCTITTGILDPIALLDWGVIDVLAHESGGHCFGISRAAEQFLLNKVPYLRFANVHSTFALPGPSGPSSDLMSYLDSQHALQFSDEFLTAWHDHHEDKLPDQLATLRSELTAGRDPIITLQGPSFGEGHAVIAYDEVETSPGNLDVYVYDSNRPYLPDAEADAGLHQSRETGLSVIHFTNENHWTFDIGGSVWSGSEDGAFASDGNLFVAKQSIIPDDPGLPGIGTLLKAIGFGSADGSVKTVSASKGAQLFPALDSHATPGAAGYWLGDDGGSPLKATFEGQKAGHYSETFTAPGFAGAVTDIATAANVKDVATGGTGGDGLRFASGMARPLHVELASRPASAAAHSGKATTWSATVQTHASAHGDDSAGLAPSGALTYGHDGAPTTIRFALSSVRANGGPARFESGPVAVRSGDKLTVKPAGADLRTVRMTVRDHAGHVRTRVLRNRAKPPARLTLGGLLLRGRKVSVKVRISGLKGGAALGVALRLRRGARTVAHHAVGVARVTNGTRTVTWTVPSAQHGALALVADARVATTGGKGTPIAGSVQAARTVRVRLG